MSENESMVTTKWHFTYSLIPRVVSRHNKMLSFKQFKLASWSLFFSFGSKNSVHQILESNADGTFCNQTMPLCTFAKPFVIIFKIFPCDKSLVTHCRIKTKCEYSFAFLWLVLQRYFVTQVFQECLTSVTFWNFEKHKSCIAFLGQRGND